MRNLYAWSFIVKNLSSCHRVFTEGTTVCAENIEKCDGKCHQILQSKDLNQLEKLKHPQVMLFEKKKKVNE